MSDIQALLVNVSAARLRHAFGRIEVCLNKLTEEQIWSRGHENENAVGNLVLHLAGNVRQWIISGLGDLPDTRVREREFSTRGDIAAPELIALLRQTVDEAARVIESLDAGRLTRTHHIQSREASGVEALLNVITHFAEHTGQIIFATKNFTGQDLKLMSPPAKK